MIKIWFTIHKRSANYQLTVNSTSARLAEQLSLGVTSSNQSVLHPVVCVNPLAELASRGLVVTTLHIFTQCGVLQRATAGVERKGGKCRKFVIVEAGHEVGDTTLCSSQIGSQQIESLLLAYRWMNL